LAIISDSDGVGADGDGMVQSNSPDSNSTDKEEEEEAPAKTARASEQSYADFYRQFEAPNALPGVAKLHMLQQLERAELAQERKAEEEVAAAAAAAAQASADAATAARAEKSKTQLQLLKAAKAKRAAEKAAAQAAAEAAAEAEAEAAAEEDAAAAEAEAAAAEAALNALNVDSFDYIAVLGEGSFGKVFLADLKGTDISYAVKVLRKKDVLDDDDVGAVMTEKEVLSLSSGSPFLTRMFATFQTPAKLYYVLEFLSGGDLLHLVQKRHTIPEEEAQFYTAEILLGLWYLHGKGILYRDLKLDNVMLTADGHVKLADFGMCKERIFPGYSTHTFCGTPGYLAPELILEQPYSYSVDLWALGVVLYEMLCGDSPFEAEDETELFELILQQPIEMPADVRCWF
jgi:hypothetical protein